MRETGNVHYNLASIDPTNGNCGQARTDEKQPNGNGTKRGGGRGDEWNEIRGQGIATRTFWHILHYWHFG